MTEPAPADLVLTLHDPAELFDGPPAATRQPAPSGPHDWDAIGAVLGESGVNRLLRMVAAHRTARRLVVRLPGVHPEDPSAGALPGCLRTWCESRIAANQAEMTMLRRHGMGALLYALLVLALALVLSWVLASEQFLGPPGVLRQLAGEALVIGGWVVMWRPFELLLIDPRRLEYEIRLLRRLLALPVTVQTGA